MKFEYLYKERKNNNLMENKRKLHCMHNKCNKFIEHRIDALIVLMIHATNVLAFAHAVYLHPRFILMKFRSNADIIFIATCEPLI